MSRKKFNPEVEKAIADRDALIANVEDAVAKVDELKDELLRQYEEADAKRLEAKRRGQ